MTRVFAHRGSAAAAIVAVVVLSSLGTEAVWAAPDAKPGASETAPTAPLPDRKAQVRQLVRQVLALSRQSPLIIERAVEVLGSRLGAERHPTPYLTKWSLAPTPFLAGGTLTRMTDGIVFQLTPLPALDLALQDFEKELLDLPYYFSAQPGHASEDGVAVAIRTVYHMFRVKAGELLFEVPAIYKAYDTAEARDRARLPVREIRITDAVEPRWKGVIAS
jgi:hypothetical protein